MAKLKRPTMIFLVIVRDLWRSFFRRLNHPYKPELHYMRGPGPAYRARHQ